MKQNRRSFLKTSASLSTALFMNSLETFAKEKPAFALPADFQIKIMATNWGFSGNWDSFCANAKEAGYNGIECWLPAKEEERKELMEAIHKHDLEFGFFCGSWEPEYKTHFNSFQKNLDACISYHPLYINCHSGKDYFSFDENKNFITSTLKAANSSGISIFHETHRSRMCYSAPVARRFLEEFPEMRVNVDLSHWCNVHESLLQDQKETLHLTLSRADHIHARIGHAEGPQVNDPRAPEWNDAVKYHFDWWDEVVQNRIKAGIKYQTVLTEFGPPTYLPTLLYTQQPVANQWEINVHIKDVLRKRYSV